MAATWPSIIPDGATMSAPALGLRHGDTPVQLDACGRCRPSHPGRQHAAMPVIGVFVEAEIGHEHQLVARLVAQIAAAQPARCHRDPKHPSLRHPSCAGTPNSITAGTPSAASSRASLRNESRVCCTTPGNDAIGWGSSIPSRTNSGATKSSTLTRVSATSRRNAGVRRSRRSRRAGNSLDQPSEPLDRDLSEALDHQVRVVERLGAGHVIGRDHADHSGCFGRGATVVRVLQRHRPRRVGAEGGQARRRRDRGTAWPRST